MTRLVGWPAERHHTARYCSCARGTDEQSNQFAVPGSVAGDILKELTPAAGEPVLPPLGPDKFIGSEEDWAIATEVFLLTTGLRLGRRRSLSGREVR